MDSKNPITQRDRLDHILEAISLIKKFVEGVEEKRFLSDVEKQSAVQYQFLIIAEAIGYIDNNILKKYDYPWHIPRSFRNYIIHEYHGIKMERIFFAAQDLDELEALIKKLKDEQF